MEKDCTVGFWGSLRLLNREEAVYACRKQGLNVDSRLSKDYVDVIVQGACSKELPYVVQQEALPIITEEEFLESLQTLGKGQHVLLYEKYVPLEVSDVVGESTKQSVRDVIAAVRDCLASQQCKPAVLLNGPCGCGKNTAVGLALKQLGVDSYNVIRIHLQQQQPSKIICRRGIRRFERNNTKVDDVLQQLRAVSTGKLPTVKVIWINDVDHIIAGKPEYRKYVREVEKILLHPKPKRVVILTTNTLTENAFVRQIRKRATIITFAAVPTKDIKQLLERIYRSELQTDAATKFLHSTTIANYAAGDVRKALLALQFELHEMKLDVHFELQKLKAIMNSVCSHPKLRNAVIQCAKKLVNSTDSQAVMDYIRQFDTGYCPTNSTRQLATNIKPQRYDDFVNFSAALLSSATPVRKKRQIAELIDNCLVEKILFILYNSMLNCRVYNSEVQAASCSVSSQRQLYRQGIDCMDSLSAAYDTLGCADMLSKFCYSNEAFELMPYISDHETLGVANGLVNLRCRLTQTVPKAFTWAAPHIPPYILIFKKISDHASFIKKNLKDIHFTNLQQPVTEGRQHMPPTSPEYATNYPSCLLDLN